MQYASLFIQGRIFRRVCAYVLGTSRVAASRPESDSDLRAVTASQYLVVWGSGSPPRVLGKAAAEFVPGRLRSRTNRDASGSHLPLSSLLRPFPLSSCRTGLIERCPHVTGALSLRISPPVSSPCLLLSAGRA